MKKDMFSLTPNEWLVMEELWKAPSTLMELVRTLSQDPPGWAKSTTATMLRRMEEKGLVYHETTGKAKVFHPSLGRQEAALAETRTLLNKAFSGNVGLLVNALAQQDSLSKEEIETLYAILRQAEGQEESK